MLKLCVDSKSNPDLHCTEMNMDWDDSWFIFVCVCACMRMCVCVCVCESSEGSDETVWLYMLG